MGNRIVTQGIGLYYQVQLRDSNGVEYSTNKNSSPRKVTPSTSTGPVGRNITYKDSYNFISAAGTSIPLEMTVTFNLNYNTANVTGLKLNPTDKNYYITFTLTSVDFFDNSGNVHNREVTGNTTATFPATLPGTGCICPPGAGGTNTVPPGLKDKLGTITTTTTTAAVQN